MRKRTSFTPTPRIQAGLIVAAVLAFVALRAPFLSLPLERDEGEYAYIAQRLLEGDVPYRDAFDQKPPGVFGAYALAFVRWRPSIEGIHLFLCLWSAATALALHGLVRSVAGPRAAGFAVLDLRRRERRPTGARATRPTPKLHAPAARAGSGRSCVRGWSNGQRLAWLACGVFAALACCLQAGRLDGRAACVAVAVRGDAILGRPTPAPARRRCAGRRSSLGGALASVPVVPLLRRPRRRRPVRRRGLRAQLRSMRKGRTAAEALESLRLALARQLPSFGAIWLLAVAGWLLPGRVRRLAYGMRSEPGGWRRSPARRSASTFGRTISCRRCPRSRRSPASARLDSSKRFSVRPRLRAASCWQGSRRRSRWCRSSSTGSCCLPIRPSRDLAPHLWMESVSGSARDREPHRRTQRSRGERLHRRLRTADPLPREAPQRDPLHLLLSADGGVIRTCARASRR